MKKIDHAWITWAVCDKENGGCGWSGWMLEAVFNSIEDLANHSSQKSFPIAPGKYDQVCVNCGHDLFRTENSVKVVPDG